MPRAPAEVAAVVLTMTVRTTAGGGVIAPGRCWLPSPQSGGCSGRPSPCREQTGGPRQEQPRARREKEIKFTLGLLTGVQCAENVGTKFTQEMQKLQKSLLTV